MDLYRPGANPELNEIEEEVFTRAMSIGVITIYWPRDAPRTTPACLLPPSSRHSTPTRSLSSAPVNILPRHKQLLNKLEVHRAILMSKQHGNTREDIIWAMEVMTAQLDFIEIPPRHPPSAWKTIVLDTAALKLGSAIHALDTQLLALDVAKVAKEVASVVKGVDAGTGELEDSQEV